MGSPSLQFQVYIYIYMYTYIYIHTYILCNSITVYYRVEGLGGFRVERFRLWFLAIVSSVSA